MFSFDFVNNQVKFATANSILIDTITLKYFVLFDERKTEIRRNDERKITG